MVVWWSSHRHIFLYAFEVIAFNYFKDLYLITSIDLQQRPMCGIFIIRYKQERKTQWAAMIR